MKRVKFQTNVWIEVGKKYFAVLDDSEETVEVEVKDNGIREPYLETTDGEAYTLDNVEEIAPDQRPKDPPGTGK